MPAADDEVLTQPDVEVDTPPSRAARRRTTPAKGSPTQRRALIGATTFGAAAALSAALLPERSSGSGAGWLSTGGSGSTDKAFAATVPEGPAPTTPTTPAAKKPSRAIANQPAAGKPAADRDSSYTAASKRAPTGGGGAPGSEAGGGSEAGASTEPRSGGEVAGNPEASSSTEPTGKVLTRASVAAQSFDPAAVVAPAGVMASELVSRGMTNTRADHEHLLGRATFGARPADRASIAKLGIDAWLTQQLDPTTLADPGGEAVRRAYPLADKDIPSVRRSLDGERPDAAIETAQMTLGMQIYSSRQLYEVVVDIFANQLHVTTPSEDVWDNAPDYQKNVIRKHAFGTFEDMLLAAMRHPAMLQYLDNDLSTKDSVNENLGRELLELHTVGVLSGYTEADVRNSAYILTGRLDDSDTGKFIYSADAHWDGGPVKVLGFSDPNTGNGLEMGDRYLRYLARHEATAQTIARKVATRFVSDNPPASLVDRLAKTYLDNETAILPVLRTLFMSTEFWTAPQAKTRRPLEDVVGTARAADIAVDRNLRKGVEHLYWRLQGLGHAPLAWIPPNGYPDVIGAWQSAYGMIQRWNMHRAITGGFIDGVKSAEQMIIELRPAEGTTYSIWLDMISHRVLGRALDPARKEAVLGSVDAKATDLVPGWMTTAKGDNKAWYAPQIAALMLDGPHHQLR
ncbi:MAG: DUF1800 domain-containing protein [Dermatophilaceae bacterium]